MSRAILFITIVSALIFINYYANPPDGYTGAPISDELSCTLCHYFDAKNLQGFTEINGLPTNIEKGKTYPIEVIVNNEDKKALRASFQLISVKNNKSIGAFSNGMDPVKFSTYKERTYAESKPGIKLENGKAIFKFDWQAPNEPDNTIISFYSTAVIADGDNTFANDKVVYTQASAIIGSNINVKIISQTNNSCRNDSTGRAKISISGGNSPYTYKWSNGSIEKNITNLKTGIHYVTVTDSNGKHGIGFVKISEPAILEFSSIVKTDQSENQKGSINIEINGGSGTYSYNWYKEGVAFSNEKNISDLTKGCYKIEVTDNNCDEKIDSTICIEDLTNSLDLVKEIDFSLFPNPTKNNIFFSNKNLFFDNIQIINNQGDKVLNKNNFSSNTKLDISRLENGVFYLIIKIRNHIYSKPFIKT